MGFVMVVIWKVVKSGRVCAGTRILLSLMYHVVGGRAHKRNVVCRRKSKLVSTIYTEIESILCAARVEQALRQH